MSGSDKYHYLRTLGNLEWTVFLVQCVFFFIDLQKQDYCELVLGLMGNPKASKWPQDREQMTFGSKILLNEIKNEFGRWKTKRRY